LNQIVFGSWLSLIIDVALVIGKVEMTANQSPKPTLETVVALRGCFSGSAAWLKRCLLI
jgi:hypothetical protein